MVAVLKLVDVRATERPAFDNTQIKQFCLWMNANLPALQAYYTDLGRGLPQDADNNLTATAKAQNFLSFIKVQWDRERGAF
jgi:hypothetical protein